MKELHHAISCMPISTLLEVVHARVEEMDSGTVESRATLHAILAVLASAGRMIRERLNEQSAVFKLPAELIYQIMKAYLHSNGTGTWPQCTVKSNIGLITLTHVCRRWRSLALATPRLWSNFHIPVYYKYETKMLHMHQAMLQRSRPAPLNIRISGQPGSCLENLLQHDASRIRCLDMWAQTAVLVPIRHLEEAWPSVEHLTIRDRLWTGPQGTIYSMPTPALRTLALISTDFLPSLSLQNLTHLAIVHCESPRWTLGDLARLLGDAHCLEELCLKELPQLPTKQDYERPQIRLPGLRRLALRKMGHTALAIWLLEHLQLPVNCAINLEEYASSPGTWQIPDIYPVQCAERLQFVDGVVTLGRTITVTATDAYQASAIRLRLIETPLVFGIPSDDERVARLGCISTVRTTWELARVRELWITLSSCPQSFQHLDDQAGITALLSSGTMTALTTIVLCVQARHSTCSQLERFCIALVEIRTPLSLLELRVWIDSTRQQGRVAAHTLTWMVRALKEQGRPLSRLLVEAAAMAEGDNLEEWAEMGSCLNSLEVRLGVPESPRMELPEACTSDTHTFWQAWQ